MSGTEINGNPTAMNTFATGLTAPAMPASLARLGAPPNLTGLVEGVMMSLLDKAATTELSAFLAKYTEDIASYSVKGNAAAAAYSTADLDSGLELVTAGAKLGQEVISFAKQQLGSGTSGSTKTGTTTNPAAGSATQTSV
ncbi:hypothetical protein [Kutzneria sp. CA-103260]|uniref:hypothetical protein n=1 Tax=Kutzneria sp. CA-103260 TaxID=2802641 RepID=UPI001BA812CC|nr:hypothetical protein [Kutzneria sp. CA-103260]QUQ67162.1 hypothetical protein JJ691_48940 [Kutzneria sp. CA-103260]